MIAWTADLVGADKVGFGSDYYDGWPVSEIKWWRAGRWARESAVPIVGFSAWPSWFKSPADFPNILEGMRRRGFADTEIAQIAGGNWLASCSVTASSRQSDPGIMPASEGFDAIVVGGGHNGLVAAGYLGRAGMRVLVLESRSILGGPCGTYEFLPGYRTAFANSPGSLEPRIVQDLDLAGHGLRFLANDPTVVQFFPGRSFIGWRAREHVASQIRCVQPRRGGPLLGSGERNWRRWPRFWASRHSSPRHRWTCWRRA